MGFEQKISKSFEFTFQIVFRKLDYEEFFSKNEPVTQSPKLMQKITKKLVNLN